MNNRANDIVVIVLILAVLVLFYWQYNHYLVLIDTIEKHNLLIREFVEHRDSNHYRDKSYREEKRMEEKWT